MQRQMTTIGFGGGCHWCTEAVFQSLRGVSDVRQGFIRSDPPDDSWSEAVLLEFTPEAIPLDILIAAHLATHASTSDHSMRGKYRSAVYVNEDSQATLANTVLRNLAQNSDAAFVTRVLLNRGFKPSDPRFHDYYISDPDKPFCKVYIDPKLAKLRQTFAEYVAQDVSIIAR